jgi:hypothetical protein
MTTEATPLANPKQSLIPATPGAYLDQAQQTALYGTPLPATALIGSEDIKKQRRKAGKFAPLGSSISTPIKSRLTNFDMEATQLSNVAEEADISEGEQSYVPTHLHKRMGRSSLIARMLEPPTHQVQSTAPAVTIAPVAVPTLAAPKPTSATQKQTAAAGGQPNDSSSSSSTTSVNPPQCPVTPGRRRRIPRQGQPPNPPAGPPGPPGCDESKVIDTWL